MWTVPNIHQHPSQGTSHNTQSSYTQSGPPMPNYMAAQTPCALPNGSSACCAKFVATSSSAVVP